MVLNILETLKKPNKAFLKFKNIRVVLESFLAKLSPFSNFSNENETKRFSKKRTQDFLKKSSYDPNYSLNNLGRYFAMVNSFKTLFGNTITAICLLKNYYPVLNKLSFQNKTNIFITYKTNI